MGMKPGQPVLEVLEGRLEEVTRIANSHTVANDLWAYATMGRDPGGRVMAALGTRIEALSRDFRPREAAKALWAACNVCAYGAGVWISIANTFAACYVVAADELDVASLGQLHQVLLSCRLEEGLSLRMPPAFLELESAWGPRACRHSSVGRPRHL